MRHIVCVGRCGQVEGSHRGCVSQVMGAAHGLAWLREPAPNYVPNKPCLVSADGCLSTLCHLYFHLNAVGIKACGSYGSC